MPKHFNSSFLEQTSSIHRLRFYKTDSSFCLGELFIQESTPVPSEFLTITLKVTSMSGGERGRPTQSSQDTSRSNSPAYLPWHLTQPHHFLLPLPSDPTLRMHLKITASKDPKVNPRQGTGFWFLGLALRAPLECLRLPWAGTVAFRQASEPKLNIMERWAQSLEMFYFCLRGPGCQLSLGIGMC